MKEKRDRFTSNALLLALFVVAFGFALVAHFAGSRLFFGRYVVCFRPMAAIRAEVPSIAGAFASIGFVMVFFALLGEGSGQLQSHS